MKPIIKNGKPAIETASEVLFFEGFEQAVMFAHEMLEMCVKSCKNCKHFEIGMDRCKLHKWDLNGDYRNCVRYYERM